MASSNMLPSLLMFAKSVTVLVTVSKMDEVVHNIKRWSESDSIGATVLL